MARWQNIILLVAGVVAAGVMYAWIAKAWAWYSLLDQLNVWSIL